jgi:hypothetical protein
MSFAVAHLDKIDEISDGRCPWKPVRLHFGITSFGVNAWVGHAAGDRIINEHDESEEGDSQEELYLVQCGRAIFELDGERVEAPAGTLVFAAGGVKRTAFAEEPGTTIVAIGGTPGKAYEPDGWELFAPVRPLYEAGKYAEAADRGRELVATHPEYAGLLYNVACCESLAGRVSDAVEHLRLAIERQGRLRSLAAKDSDFDPIRREPPFRDLVGWRDCPLSQPLGSRRAGTPHDEIRWVMPPAAIVLHSPGFCVASMMCRTRPCRAVVECLVGNSSATGSSTSALRHVRTGDRPYRPTLHRFASTSGTRSLPCRMRQRARSENGPAGIACRSRWLRAVSKCPSRVLGMARRGARDGRP